MSDDDKPPTNEDTNDLLLTGHMYGAPAGRTGAGEISPEGATRLLELALRPRHSPRDRLLAHLASAEDDGAFRELLARGPAGKLGEADRLLVHGEATLDQLQTLKEASKQLLKAGGDAEIVAALSYFLTLAAARVHRDTAITSQPADAAATLNDLSALAPDAWQELLLDAADRLTADAKA